MQNDKGQEDSGFDLEVNKHNSSTIGNSETRPCMFRCAEFRKHWITQPQYEQAFYLMTNGRDEKTFL